MKVIILAGGTGTRLWPLSRERYPKQFIQLQSEKESLFQKTFKRSLLLSGENDIYIITNEKYKFLVMGQVEELGYEYEENNVLLEPEAKNTLPAIYAGVHEILKSGNDTVVVFPSDHIIVKDKEFADLIKTSEKLTDDSLITFGIKPNGPNTGYGYIPQEILKKMVMSLQLLKKNQHLKKQLSILIKVIIGTLVFSCLIQRFSLKR